MIKTMTLGYNTVEKIIEQSKKSAIGSEHYVLDIGFPIRGDFNGVYDNKNWNSNDILYHCYSNGWNYLKPARNRGVSQNWDFAFREMEVGLDDVIIGIEPDEVALNDGWVQAMADVIGADRKMALCSLNTDGHQQMINEGGLAGHRETIGGVSVFVVDGLSNWAMIGFNGTFLHRMGGIPTPKGANIYGHIESACYPYIKEAGYRWCILLDYFCEHIESEPLYREWKTSVTSGKYANKEQIQFDDWLKKEKGFI